MIIWKRINMCENWKEKYEQEHVGEIRKARRQDQT